MMAKLAPVNKVLEKEADQVVTVFITVDPRRDTAAF